MITGQVENEATWDRSARESIVAQAETPLLHHQVGLGLALGSRGGDRRSKLVLAVLVNDDAVLGQLLIDENDLL